MPHHLLHVLGSYLIRYGYWTVAAALLLENAGLPLPGETILLLASFFAYSQHNLRLSYIILVGICAATIGDNLGFLIGHYGGRALLHHYGKTLRIREAAIRRGEDLFARYGAATIFVARFIAGMRVIAGPLAGVLRMDWRKFVIFNFLGAALWVTVIATAGYLFGGHWYTLFRVVKGFNVLVLVAAVAALALLWFRRTRRVKGY
jgi:membrane protein DedA with SNARE-associated domain